MASSPRSNFGIRSRLNLTCGCSVSCALGFVDLHFVLPSWTETMASANARLRRKYAQPITRVARKGGQCTLDVVKIPTRGRFSESRPIGRRIAPQAESASLEAMRVPGPELADYRGTGANPRGNTVG